MADLAIDIRTEGGRVALALSGEFDMAAVPQFDKELAAVEAGSPPAIVVDLTGLQFMDSSGLRALVTADDRARRAGRRLAIVPGATPVRRVFEITQLDQRLDLVEDVSAVAAD